MASNTTHSKANSYAVLELDVEGPCEAAVTQTVSSQPTARHTRTASQQKTATLDIDTIITGLNALLIDVDKPKQDPEWFNLWRREHRNRITSILQQATALSDTHGATLRAHPADLELSNENDTTPSWPSKPTGAPKQSCNADMATLIAHEVESSVKRQLAEIYAKLSGEIKALQPAPVPTQAYAASTRTGTLASGPASGECRAPPVREPDPSRQKQRVTDRDITVTLQRAERADALRALTEADILAKVEAVVSLKFFEGASRSTVHAIKKLANGDIRIRTRTEEIKTRLIEAAREWLPVLACGAEVVRDLFTIEVTDVPTTFVPDATGAVGAIYQANAHLFPSRSSVISVRWMYNHANKSNKKSSSLLVTTDSLGSVVEANRYGVSVQGRICTAQVYVPKPKQCFHCLSWSHILKDCPDAQSNLPARCGRCAKHHPLNACVCPNTPRCSDARRCTHISHECAHCGPGSAHTSFDDACPAKQRAAAAVKISPSTARARDAVVASAMSPAPPRVGNARAGPTTSEDLRNLAFASSDEPRAVTGAWHD